jgi:hypothetical protein
LSEYIDFTELARCADFLGAYTLLSFNKMPINNSKSLAEKYAEMDLNSTKAYARKEGIEEYRSAFRLLMNGRCSSTEDLTELGIEPVVASVAFDDFAEISAMENESIYKISQ